MQPLDRTLLNFLSDFGEPVFETELPPAIDHQGNTEQRKSEGCNRDRLAHAGADVKSALRIRIGAIKDDGMDGSEPTGAIVSDGQANKGNKGIDAAKAGARLAVVNAVAKEQVGNI